MENKENKVYYFRGNKQRGPEGIRKLLVAVPGSVNNHSLLGENEECIYFINKNHEVDCWGQGSDFAVLLYSFGTEIKLPRTIEKGDIMVNNTEHSFAVVWNKPAGSDFFYPLFTIVDGNIKRSKTLEDDEWHLANNDEMHDFMQTLDNLSHLVDNVCKPFNGLLTVNDFDKIKIKGEIHAKENS